MGTDFSYQILSQPLGGVGYKQAGIVPPLLAAHHWLESVKTKNRLPGKTDGSNLESTGAHHIRSIKHRLSVISRRGIRIAALGYVTTPFIQPIIRG
jgi:hypothetical protein